MAQITVYTTDPCSFCIRVKQLLTVRGVEYVEVNLSKDPEGRAQLVERTGMLSFPQVVIGDEVIGGFRETYEADRSGRLRELLAALRYRALRRMRGRFWQVSQQYVPRPAATNFTISVPQRTHGSPRRRCT